MQFSRSAGAGRGCEAAGFPVVVFLWPEERIQQEIK